MWDQVRRRLAALITDALVVMVAAVFALAVQENFFLSLDHLMAAAPYLAASAGAAFVVWPAIGLDRSLWRYGAIEDQRQLALAALLSSLVALSSTWLVFGWLFATGPSVGLQALVSFLLLSAVRLSYRRVRNAIGTARRRHRQQEEQQPEWQPANVLVVGLGALTETLLRGIEEHSAKQFRVVGLLAPSNRFVGHIAGRHEILGRPEDVASVIETLRVHGVEVNRILVTCPPERLTEKASLALRRISIESGIELQLLAEKLGFETREPHNSRGDPTVARLERFALDKDVIWCNGKRRYWAIKRLVDILLATAGLILVAPIMLLAAMAILITMGRPIVFWQERPGLGGVPFRLIKLRTMRDAIDALGRRRLNNERISTVGAFLRRTRLDELPQLINILRGEMSFIGPRPLLSGDQETCDRARLLIRPGLTGLSQVSGGRGISARDKAALDVWYALNASVWLDFKIALLTVPIILFGDKVNKTSIEKAWHDLSRSGITTELGDIRGLPGRT